MLNNIVFLAHSCESVEMSRKLTELYNIAKYKNIML